MGWNKREAVTDLTILGDAEGNVAKAGGLLASLIQDRMYPANVNYELVQKNGESITLAGSASLSRQIGPADVGKFIKATFQGWGKSANGKFKQIEVLIWEDEPSADMKAWPRWAELQAQMGAGAKVPVAATATKAKQKEHLEDFPEALDAEDDDLPF